MWSGEDFGGGGRGIIVGGRMPLGKMMKRRKGRMRMMTIPIPMTKMFMAKMRKK